MYSFTLGDDDGNSGNYHEFDWRGPAFGTNPLDVPVNDSWRRRGGAHHHGHGHQPGRAISRPWRFKASARTTSLGRRLVDQDNLNYSGISTQTTVWLRRAPVVVAAAGGVDPGTVRRPEGPIDMTDPMRMPPIVEALDTEANGGPGGLITGMAIIDGVMYFVSEEGGFYKREGEVFEFITRSKTRCRRSDRVQRPDRGPPPCRRTAPMPR